MGSAPNPLWRARFELALRVLGPALDAVLTVAERVSRVLDPEEPGYELARMKTRDGEAPRRLVDEPARRVRRPGA